MVLAVDRIGEKPDAILAPTHERFKRMAINFKRPVLIQRFSLPQVISQNQDLVTVRKNEPIAWDEGEAIYQ
jgi:hypothetical protein